MPNHMHKSATIVENGTVPDECLPRMKKLRRNVIPNMMPGYMVAV